MRQDPRAPVELLEVVRSDSQRDARRLLMLPDLDAEAPSSALMTPATAAAFWRTDSLSRGPRHVVPLLLKLQRGAKTAGSRSNRQSVACCLIGDGAEVCAARGTLLVFDRCGSRWSRSSQPRERGPVLHAELVHKI